MPDRSPPPRIGFNAALLSLSDDYRAAGIHRYIIELLRALAELGGSSITAHVTDPQARAALPESIAVRLSPRIARRPFGRILWEQLALPVALWREGADVYHGPAYAGPLLASPPRVITVHDLSFFRHPETFPGTQGGYLRTATRHAARAARALIAVSDFTRREIVDLLGVPPSRIHVVPNGVDPAYRPATPDEVAACRDRLGLPKRYVLTLGTLQPRKNLGTLLEGYAHLCRLDPGAPDLVVGGAPGWGDRDPMAAAERLGIAARVHFTGYVPGRLLPALYTGAAVFAYPSRYEGFGLPVVEAMACGTPTVVADAASLPEVGGAAVLTVSPDEPRDWGAALVALLASRSRRDEMSTLGRARAAGFTWARAARATRDVYHAVLGKMVPAARQAHGEVQGG